MMPGIKEGGYAVELPEPETEEATTATVRSRIALARRMLAAELPDTSPERQDRAWGNFGNTPFGSRSDWDYEYRVQVERPL